MNTPLTPERIAAREPTVRRTRSNALFDISLLQRHAEPAAEAARYPSLALDSTFGEQDFRAHVARSNGALIPRHLSLYVHLPHCVNPDVHCSADCTVTPDLRGPRSYLESLRREITEVARLFDRDREILELHLGGGTPNLLGCVELADLMSSLGHHFRFGPARQRSFSIALDPGLVQDSDIAAYAALGLNHARLGASVAAVHTPDASTRHTGRNRPLDRLLAAIDSCHANGFRSVTLEVSYDAAGQSPASLQRLLDLVLTARPDHLVFSRAAKTPAACSKPATAEQRSRFELLMVAAERLSGAGYEYLGLDDFVLTDHALLQARRTGTLGCSLDGYTMHGDCDRLGLGVGAASRIGDSVSRNHTAVSEWEAALDAGRLPVACGRSLELDDIVRVDVIQQVLCQGVIDIAGTQDRHDVELTEYFAAALQKLQPLIGDHLVECDDRWVIVTARGRPLLGSIAACFT